MSEPHYSSTTTGWREWVSLPDIGVSWIKAKIDTGAQTSALHASAVEEFSREGETWVRFRVHPWQRSEDDAVTVELPLHDRRTVRSSSGHAQDRLVVLMDIELLGHRRQAEMTLASREEMVFRMLVGREVLGQGFTVDPSASYLGGRPPREIRRRNRGRAEGGAEAAHSAANSPLPSSAFMSSAGNLESRPPSGDAPPRGEQPCRRSRRS
ncbi:ATP-dependent zinc protease family protein [Leucobacter chromiisoli]|uniref:ATP-dependent zinc protease family protein n=1 Tax=Leucobacter chromiisoli TaxID=2796471 RepID=UPI0027DBFBAF|nr:RimK/LysX family protein [Leucobacter chromiisoli]